MTIDEYLCDATINNISRCCDLVKLDFKKNDKIICLHIQASVMRVFKKDEMILSSYDMYVPGKTFKKHLFKSFHWDIPGQSLYDEKIAEYRKELLFKKVKAVIIIGKDLVLYLENEYKFEVLAFTLDRGRELFRVFIKGDLDSHNVFES